MRAPVDRIAAPSFEPQLRWLNLEGRRLRVEQLRGRPFLVEFFDFCRPNSIRTLPYLKAWHERYGSPAAGEIGEASGDASGGASGDARGGANGDARGGANRGASGRANRDARDGASGEASGGASGADLTVIGVHSPGFAPSRDEDAVAQAVSRLGIEYPVLLDTELSTWQEYENLGWPARYLFDGRGILYDYHYGEGAYTETELAIQELLPAQVGHPEPIAPLRPEDAPDAVLAPQTEDQEGLYSGPYEAGGVWAVLDGAGVLSVNGGEADGGLTLAVSMPGAYPLIEHDRHTAGVVSIEPGAGLRCLATCFTPGVV